MAGWPTERQSGSASGRLSERGSGCRSGQALGWAIGSVRVLPSAQANSSASGPESALAMAGAAG